MSYILRKKFKGKYQFFKDWNNQETKEPEFADALKFAKHWSDKTNCKRFLARNHTVLKNMEVFRVIKERICALCKTEIDRDARTTAKFCSDYCRIKSWENMNRKNIN